MDLSCFCSVLCLLCLCARLFICALWSPAGKGLTSWLSFVVSTVSLSLSHWYPGSGVVLDCIDSYLCTLTYFGYNLDIMRQSACLVLNPITVYSYGFLFNCTMVGQASDSMAALT